MKSILETWRPVVGYAGYEVSDSGFVRSHHGKNGVRYLKCIKSKYGYSCINLYKNGKIKQFFVHRLVWEAFNSPVPYGMQLDHIDGDKTNNALSNLRCVTPKENTNNPVTRKRQLDGIAARETDKDFIIKRREGIKKSHSKPVLQIDKDTDNIIKKWESISDAAREFSLDYRTISACCHGRCKTAGGYRWKFA